MAISCALSIATLTACGSTRSVASHTAARKSAATPTPAHAVVASSHPVHQLPPGQITLASVRTSEGPIAIVAHRIRYFGHVSLCVGAASADGGTEQSCARYPVGPKSNQHLGDAPVWWATTYVGVCSARHFQVVGGVLLRRGLSAWLRTPSGVSRMASAAIPKAFGVAGPLLYADITAASGEEVTLRDAAGKTVYTAAVDPLIGVPTLRCTSSTFAGGMISRSSTGAAVLTRPGQDEVP